MLGVESLEDDYLIEGDDNSHSHSADIDADMKEEELREIEGKEELREIKKKKKTKKNKKFNHLTFNDYGMENGVKMEYCCKVVVEAGGKELGNGNEEEKQVLQPKWCNIIDSSMLLQDVGRRCTN